jgi:hypothetical protein
VPALIAEELARWVALPGQIGWTPTWTQAEHGEPRVAAAVMDQPGDRR